ncbi:MAG: hypothetical protein IPP33_11560 [Flavobacteriales bacterium]|nr:hypothetical protein [Flavobacteriales bacterium]
MLTAYPNPSDGKEPVYLVAQLPEGMEQAILRVVDPAGRTITQTSVTPRTGIVEVAAKGMAAGLYSAALFANGVQLSAAKFEVIR